jgi:hypothetical protein
MPPTTESATPETVPETNVAEVLTQNFAGLNDADGSVDDTKDFLDSFFDEEPAKPTEDEASESSEKPDETHAVEEKPAEEKPESSETPAAGDEDMPEGLTDRRKTEWRDLKAARKEAEKQANDYKSRAAELEKQLGDAKKELAAVPELREKAKFFEEAEQELAVARVEGTREYKETISGPLKAIDQSMESIAKDNNVSVEKIFDALEEPDPAKRRAALKEVTADMDDVDRQEVYQASRDVQVLLAKRAEIHAKASEAAKESKAAQDARAAEESRRAKSQFEAAVDQAVDGLAERIPVKALVPEGQDSAAWLANIADQAKASEFEGGRKAYAVTAALLLPKVNAKLNDSLGKIKTLEARIAELTDKGASVTVGDDTPSASAETGDPFEAMAQDLGTPGIHRDVLSRLASV